MSCGSCVRGEDVPDARLWDGLRRQPVPSWFGGWAVMSWSAGFRARQYVRQSLWVVPLVGGLVGVLLATLDLWLESRIALPPAWTYSEGTANSVLSAARAAMVGLIGFVVTIGVLVVQMATGTLSPRFMRLWYRDRLQKLVLAAFTATCAFAYALLRQAGSGNVPNLGVTIAGVAVTADLVLLLLYLDRFVHALRPVAVGAAMAKGGRAVAAELEQEPPTTPQAVPRDWDATVADLHVLAPRSGAIQAVHTEGLLRFADA